MTENNENNAQNSKKMPQNEQELYNEAKKQQDSTKNNVEDAMKKNPEMQAELDKIIEEMRKAQSENNVVGIEVKGVNIEDIKGEKGSDEGKGNSNSK